jgi:peptide/nickel transport system permease protein
MLTFLCRRLLRGLVTLLTVLTVVFFATRFSGDPLEWILRDDATETQRELTRAHLGLDRPLIVQYGIYLSNAVRGDFGNSFRERRPANLLFIERLPATVRLASLAFILSLCIGIPVGIVAALNFNKPLDRFVMSLTFVGQALPNYVLGITGILVFSLFLRWLPSAGMTSWRHFIMPVVTLGTASAAIIARLTRSGMLDIIRQDYVRTAYAKGLTQLRVNLKHAFRNAALPVITVLGLQMGTLIAGSVIVETVFAWPGVGRLLVNAVTNRDFPVIQFGVVAIATSIVIANAITDLIYGVLDPRVRSV